jgi:transcriptional regulator with XRE-family HTH domain
MSISSDKAFLQQLGKRIVALRKERGLSQQDLAYRIGMEKSNLSVIENGKSNPQVLTLLKISSAMNIEPHYLLKFDFDVQEFMESPVEYTPRKHGRQGEV